MPDAKRSALPRLKEIREARGLTMRELEARSGVSKTTIYQIERGQRNAQDNTTRRLADALRVQVRELIFPPEQVEAANRENEEINEIVYRQLASMTDEQLAALANGPMFDRLVSVMDLSRLGQVRERAGIGS